MAYRIKLLRRRFMQTMWAYIKTVYFCSTLGMAFCLILCTSEKGCVSPGGTCMDKMECCSEKCGFDREGRAAGVCAEGVSLSTQIEGEPRLDRCSLPIGAVRKTVFSSKMRLLALVGLEGSGHHIFRTVITSMGSEEDAVIQTEDIAFRPLFGLEQGLTANGRREIRREMERLAAVEHTIQHPGVIIDLDTPSYPYDSGADKVMKYTDLRMLAQFAEEEGLDFRVIYLQRSAKDMLIADTMHRHFQNSLGDDPDTTTPEALLYHFVKIMFTNAAVMSSMLNELDEAFVVCHRYDLMTNENQARDVATFISPSAEVAEMFFMTLMDTAEARSGASEELPFPDADIAAERIQQKLDVFEPTYCSSA